MAKGKSILWITGFLELLLGLLSGVMIIMILTQKEMPIALPGYSMDLAKETLLTLVLIYSTIALQVLTGIAGFIFGGNSARYKVCLVLGILCLILGCVGQQLSGNQDIFSYITNLAVPALFIYGALQNRKSQ